MPNYTLQVPLVGQKVGYDGRPLMQPDRNGQMKQHGLGACWYAAACMVSYFYRPGPRIGLTRVWNDDNGLTPAAISQLAAAEGLRVVAKPRGGLTPENVESLLRANGPIWAAGYYLDGYPQFGHAIVLSGVQGTVILYNDPWEPRAKQRPWQWISANMHYLPNVLLAKDTTRS